MIYYYFKGDYRADFLNGLNQRILAISKVSVYMGILFSGSRSLS